jgi:transcription antitermination factor NusG
VFLRGGLERRNDILTTAGVHKFVENGDTPAKIPTMEIEAIRRVIETKAYVEPHSFLRNGDWVMIKYGPLTGIEGILVQKKNWLRLVLSVEMLGKSVAVEVDSSAVERVCSPVRRRNVVAPFLRSARGGNAAGA